MNCRDSARGCIWISFVVMTLCATARAEDWPTYRHDNARSGVTAEQLLPPLSQQWVFAPGHVPEPAWPVPAKERPRVRFDDAYHVAVAGDAVYFGSSADNKVYSRRRDRRPALGNIHGRTGSACTVCLERQRLRWLGRWSCVLSQVGRRRDRVEG